MFLVAPVNVANATEQLALYRSQWPDETPAEALRMTLKYLCPLHSFAQVIAFSEYRDAVTYAHRMNAARVFMPAAITPPATVHVVMESWSV